MITKCQSAKPAITLNIRSNRFMQIGRTKLGPTAGRDPQFRVADLPQEEIADSHFTRRSDQQIWIGTTGRVQMRGNCLFGDLLRARFGRWTLRAMPRTASTTSARPP